MLNTHRSRLPVSRVLGVCAAIALVAIILPVAGVVAGSQAATSRFSGTVMDTVGRAMPDLRLVLTSAGDKSTRDASSDDAGRFEFRDLLPGEYVIRIERAGFAPVQGRVALESGQDLEQDIALQIGSVALPGQTPADEAASQVAWSKRVSLREYHAFACQRSLNT